MLMELHLKGFEVRDSVISAAFTTQSALYLIVSLTSARFLSKYDERTIMTIGIFVMAAGHIVIAPWSVIMPR
jgi:fucose permease